MTLGDIIINCKAYKEFSFVYAKRKKEKFSIKDRKKTEEICRKVFGPDNI